MNFILNYNLNKFFILLKHILVFMNFTLNTTNKKNLSFIKSISFNCTTPFLFLIPVNNVDSIREIFLIGFLVLALFFSLIVLTAQNPIFSALALMATYVFSGFLLMCFGLEIYGIYFILIYAGAISVLILFVVMMINLRFKEKTQNNNMFWSTWQWVIGIAIVLTSLMFHFSLEYLANTLLFVTNGCENLSITLDELDIETRDELIDVTILFPLLFSNDFLFIISLSLLLLLIGMVGASFLVLASRKNT